jgi:hypothetical protein
MIGDMGNVTVDKSKFDALLGKMLVTPPLPKSAVRVAKPKPKKKSQA